MAEVTGHVRHLRLAFAAAAVGGALVVAPGASADTPEPIVLELDATFSEPVSRPADGPPRTQVGMRGALRVSGAVNAVVELPLGAHMVIYGGEHVEGPWHGGGWIPDAGSPNVSVPLTAVLQSHFTSETTGTLTGSWTIGPYAGSPFAGLRAEGEATCDFDLDPTRNFLRCTLTGSGHFPPGGQEQR